MIILSWKDEDPHLPVSLEIKELSKTLADMYNYNVEEWLIPADDSHNKLQTKVLQFLGDSDPRHLKIVYYAGHGKLTNHGQPAWTRYVFLKYFLSFKCLTRNYLQVVEIVDEKDAPRSNGQEFKIRWKNHAPMFLYF